MIPFSDRSPDIDNDSDDDEPQEFNDQESSSNDELSDSEGMMLVEDGRTRPRKTSRGQIRPVTSRVSTHSVFLQILKIEIFSL